MHFFVFFAQTYWMQASEDLRMCSRTVVNIVPDYSNKSVLKTLLFLSTLCPRTISIRLELVKNNCCSVVIKEFRVT